MKKFWLVVLSVFLLVTTSAAAKTTYPSVVGEWMIEGTQKAKVSLKGYGSRSEEEMYYGNAVFDQDGRFWIDSEYLGTWVQTKNKIFINIDTTDFEMMINELIYDETGLDIYVEVIGVAGKAKISKDGMRMSGGKLYMKFTIAGEGLVGKATYTLSFTGGRSGEDQAMSAHSLKEEQSGIVGAFGNILIREFLRKK